MYDALRMYQHIHLFRGETEKPAGLDDLKPLVHKGRRIYGDLSAHAPVGMLQRLFCLYVFELVSGLIDEGPSRGSQAYPPDFSSVVSFQALGDSRMLTVHRDDPDPMEFRFLHNDLAGHHECFL